MHGVSRERPCVDFHGIPFHRSNKVLEEGVLQGTGQDSILKVPKLFMFQYKMYFTYIVIRVRDGSFLAKRRGWGQVQTSSKEQNQDFHLQWLVRIWCIVNHIKVSFILVENVSDTLEHPLISESHFSVLRNFSLGGDIRETHLISFWRKHEKQNTERNECIFPMYFWLIWKLMQRREVLPWFMNWWHFRMCAM